MAEIIKLDGARQLDFDRETVEQAYDRWAPIYDLVFGGVFSKGRRAAILATNKIGGRVLEVGVGTGISLPQYAPHLRIFGTDIWQNYKKAISRVGIMVESPAFYDYLSGRQNLELAARLLESVRTLCQKRGLCQLPGSGGRGTGASRLRGQLRAAGGPQEHI